MKIFNALWIAFIILSTFSCNPVVDSSSQNTNASKSANRIISLNGTITELLFELGLGSQIVATDVTSTFPEQSAKLPKLGHVRLINVEAVLSQKPDIIFVDEKSSELPALQNIIKSGVKVKIVPVSNDFDGPVKAAEKISEYLKIDDMTALENLKRRLEKEKNVLNAFLSDKKESPKVLFIYARGAKTLMVSGKNTPIASMIALSGGKNAFDDFEDFKPLTPEALLEVNPDVILLFESGLNSLADDKNNISAMENLLNIPGISETNAGKNKRVISMDGQYLSGFGPRAVQAALELSKELFKK